MSSPVLWYPKAAIVKPPLPSMGRYELGFPRGAVVHFTAGGPGLVALDIARSEAFTYFLIDAAGLVHQGFPLDRWGQHAGASSWPALGDHVSRHLVGIEIECPGLVKADGHGNFVSWWGAPVPMDHVRVVTAKENRQEGAYAMYSEAQEDALADLLLWLKGAAPSIFDLDLVLGHDEVSPGRKSDPGGSLSFTMPAFRAYLKMRFDQRRAAGGGSTAA